MPSARYLRTRTQCSRAHGAQEPSPSRAPSTIQWIWLRQAGAWCLPRTPIRRSRRRSSRCWTGAGLRSKTTASSRCSRDRRAWHQGRLWPAGRPVEAYRSARPSARGRVFPSICSSSVHRPASRSSFRRSLTCSGRWAGFTSMRSAISLRTRRSLSSTKRASLPHSNAAPWCGCPGTRSTSPPRCLRVR